MEQIIKCVSVCLCVHVFKYCRWHATIKLTTEKGRVPSLLTCRFQCFSFNCPFSLQVLFFTFFIFFFFFFFFFFFLLFFFSFSARFDCCYYDRFQCGQSMMPVLSHVLSSHRSPIIANVDFLLWIQSCPDVIHFIYWMNQCYWSTSSFHSFIASVSIVSETRSYRLVYFDHLTDFEFG